LIKDLEGYVLEKRSIDSNGDQIGRVMQIITKDERGNIVILNGLHRVIQVVNIRGNSILIDETNAISVLQDIFGNTVYERQGRTLFIVGTDILDRNLSRMETDVKYVC